jgi:hypothetical protein
MNPHLRPKGRTETAILMSVTNAMGWLIVDWSKPGADVCGVHDFHPAWIFSDLVLLERAQLGKDSGSTYVPTLPLQFAIHFSRWIHGADNDWSGSSARRVSLVVA